MSTPRRSTRAIVLCVLGTLAMLAADLGSKEWASEALSVERLGTPPPVCSGRGMQRLPNAGVVLVEGYLELSYAENCGAAFGLLRDADDWVRRIVFGVAALGASIALMWMFVMGRGGPMFAWSVPFVVSGALGNLVDRVRHGYVVDFIRFHVYDKFEYPTFNIADVTIVVGVALLFLDGLRKEGGKPATGAKTDANADPKGEASSGGPRSREGDALERRTDDVSTEG